MTQDKRTVGSKETRSELGQSTAARSVSKAEDWRTAVLAPGAKLALVLCFALIGLGCPDEKTTADAVDTTVADTNDTSLDTTPSSSTLVIDPSSLEFGQIARNDSKVLDLELENAGLEPIRVTQIATSRGDGAFSANLTNLTLAPQELRVIKVSFFGLTQGDANDELVITSNAANGPVQRVPLTGKVGDTVCVDGDGDLHGEGCAAGRDCRDNDALVYFGAPERCNRDDDDCDQLFDEDFVGLQQACEVGFGICKQSGFGVCNTAGTGVVCSASLGGANVETCNGLDDDCDSLTDEDFPSKGALCSVGLGACRVVDKFGCSTDGLRLECPVTALAPKVEVCSDRIDNDCDGVTDEGRIEVCADTVDNDCDGMTDESGSRWGELFFARDWYDQTVAVYPATGDGSFQEPIPLAFPSANRFSVHAVGDFDGDRWLDLIVLETLTEGRTVCGASTDCATGFTCADGLCRKLCTNDGQCVAFVGEQCIDTRSHPISNDTYCLPERRVLLARSACGGSDAISLTPLFTLQPGDQLGPVADVDGNGHLDFAALGDFADGKNGALWLNNGSGTFQEMRPAFNYAPLFGPGLIGHWSWGLVKSAKDLTGDGYVDLLGFSQASTGSQPTDLWLMEGRGDGTFEAMTALSVDFPLPANLITTNDFDGDGDQDIVGGLDEDGQPGAAFILLNLASEDASGWVQAYPVLDVAPNWNAGNEKPGLGDGTSWDFDGDDQPDIIAAWIPEECGSFIYQCTDVTAPEDICFGGNCRKIGLLRNTTRNACGAGKACVAGQCTSDCVADCDGKSCGSDGCGGSCGPCGFGQVCAGGECVVDCVPDCDGRQCGDDGCGSQCGRCPAGFSCVDGGCTNDCIPDCQDKACGDDGCGGTCAIFSAPTVIAFDDNPATVIAAPANVPPTRPVVRIEPANPGPNADLFCEIGTASYDLDPVRYLPRWFRNGIYQKGIGGSLRVPANLTESGDRWTCKIIATDGIERSPESEATVTIP